MSLHDALVTVENLFLRQNTSMDFLFTQKYKEERIVTFTLRGLPKCLLRVANEDSNIIRFESISQNTPQSLKSPPKIGWSHIEFDKFRRKDPPNTYTHCFMAIPYVSQVLAFDYGFSILSHSGIELFTINSSYWDNSAIGELMAKTGDSLQIPLCDLDEYPSEVLWADKEETYVETYAKKNLILED